MCAYGGYRSFRWLCLHMCANGVLKVFGDSGVIEYIDKDSTADMIVIQ